MCVSSTLPSVPPAHNQTVQCSISCLRPKKICLTLDPRSIALSTEIMRSLDNKYNICHRMCSQAKQQLSNENAMQSRNDGKQRYTTEWNCIERMRKYVIAWIFEFLSGARLLFLRYTNINNINPKSPKNILIWNWACLSFSSCAAVSYRCRKGAHRTGCTAATFACLTRWHRLLANLAEWSCVALCNSSSITRAPALRHPMHVYTNLPQPCFCAESGVSFSRT